MKISQDLGALCVCDALFESCICLGRVRVQDAVFMQADFLLNSLVVKIINVKM